MKHEHLPHIDIEGFYQFVTFRTHDSTDSYLKKLSLQNKANSEIQLDIDQYLDSSQKGAYLTGEALAYLRDFLISKDGILFELVAFSIMPYPAGLSSINIPASSNFISLPSSSDLPYCSSFKNT